MCSVCDGGRTGQDDPAALVNDATCERALVLRVEIEGKTNTITLRQTDEPDQYQSKWRVGDSAQPEQTTCRRAETLALIGKILSANGYLGAEYRPVEEVWHCSARSNRSDNTDGETQ